MTNEHAGREGVALTEEESLRAEWLEFTTALGFGDGVTEPAATPRQIIEFVDQAFSEAAEYREGPRICENCGEWLATAVCEPCHGSGCGPGTATGAYEECEHCAGVGKVHPGCVGESYADLAARLAAQPAPAPSRTEAECRHVELPDTMWSRLRRAETDADQRLALLRAVVSHVDANGADLPLTLLDQIRAEIGGPR